MYFVLAPRKSSAGGEGLVFIRGKRKTSVSLWLSLCFYSVNKQNEISKHFTHSVKIR